MLMQAHDHTLDYSQVSDPGITIGLLLGLKLRGLYLLVGPSPDEN
jgi:hypothetical protein